MTSVRKIPKPQDIDEANIVTLKQCGNVLEALWLSRCNHQATIRKLDKDTYVLISTGEILKFKHKDNRADNAAAVRTSLKRLRDYINTNVIDIKNCRWITLTYAENMTDTKRLYTDLEKFRKRLQYRYGKHEAITAVEPQGRGAWHAHIIAIFDHKAPFIPNKVLAEIWGFGFVKITKLDGIENIGIYLTAYLGDMEVPQGAEALNVKEVQSDGKLKRIVKGARLKMYPTGLNLYRITRGIKPPTVEVIQEKELQARVKDIPLTYEKAIELTLDNGKTISMFYRYYNAKREGDDGV